MGEIRLISCPDIYTERLLLRRLKNEDAYEILTIRSDEKISEFLDRPIYNSIDEAKKFIKMINTGIDDNKSLYWGVTFKDISKIIGTICLWKFSEDRTKAEVGFELLVSHQGKGIMQEALAAVIKYAFEILKLNSLDAEVVPGNKKSISLLERNKFLKINKIRENDSEDVKAFRTIMYELKP